jgi:hypothetical protein
MMSIGAFMSKIELQIEKCYLDSLKVVMNHSVQEDLLFTFGKGLKKIAADLGGEIKVNQGVDLMPLEVPRVTIQAKDMYVNFGLNRMEVGVKGSRKHVRNDDLLSNYKHRLEEIKLLMLAYIQDTGAKEDFIGMVAPVRFPQDIGIPKEFLIQTLHKMFVGKCNFALTGFSFKIGLFENGFYENYEVSDYEVKNIRVYPPSSSPSLINLDEYPTVEKGLLISVDVNNKSQSMYHFSTDYMNVSTHFFNAVKNCRKLFKEEYHK